MKKRTILALLLVFCLAFIMSPAASARDSVDVDRESTLTIFCDYEGLTLPGVTFRIWRVASLDSSFKFTPTEAFSVYGVSWSQDAAGWSNLAETLVSYAIRDNIAPDYTVQTGTDGYTRTLTVPVGLYLIVGSSLHYGNMTYGFTPTLVTVPVVLEDETLLYDVVASPKKEAWPDIIPPPPPTENIHVLKIWKDISGAFRPDEITVELLRDGVVIDTVVLNAANNWRYTWRGLSSGYYYRVVEKTVPAGYTVDIAKEGITFVITNTEIEPPPPPPDQPDNPVEPPPPPPDEPVTPEEPTLPETGQLWWPVPMLILLGLMFLAIGVIRRKREQ